MKPTKPKTLNEEFYMIDAVVDPTVKIPEIIKSHIRHLLIACELGDLVVIQGITKDDQPAYVLCAHVLSADHSTHKLLPICELTEDVDKLLGIRPPRALPENVFARPAFSGAHCVDVIDVADDVPAMHMRDDNSSVH